MSGMVAALGAHAGFILAAYAATAIVLGGLALAIWRDYRAQKRRLAELEGPAVGRPAGPSR